LEVGELLGGGVALGGSAGQDLIAGSSGGGPLLPELVNQGQYARYPSFLSVQKVALGRGQFRLLLWGVTQRLAGLPPERRPRVLVFGESMGAWTSSDVIMFQGIEGFDHYGIDRALWVGLPWLSKWSRSGMARGSHTLVPPGTVRVFDRHDQLRELTDDQRARLRAVVVSHDNDPIAVLGPDLLVQRPRGWPTASGAAVCLPPCAGSRWRPSSRPGWTP
jgi:uncharacterized membrane protein